MHKTDEVRRILEEDPDLPTEMLSTMVGCSRRHVRRIRAELYGLNSKIEKTALVMADIHAPYHNNEALKAVLNYGRDLDPDIVVLNGDFLDCYDISFWKTDPTRMRFPDEVKAAQKVLRKITRAFPDARKVYLEGNHELRLLSFLYDKASKLYGLEVLTVPGLLNLKELGWEFISNRDLLMAGKPPFKLGDLNVLHGHEMRVAYTVVNIPRVYFMKAMQPVMIAHHHTSQEYVAKKLDHEYMYSCSIGCLCDLSVEYSPVNNWNAGFAVVKWDDTGDFTVENKRIIGDQIQVG